MKLRACTNSLLQSAGKVAIISKRQAALFGVSFAGAFSLAKSPLLLPFG